MNTRLQITLGIGMLIVLGGTLFYEARKASVLAAQIQGLRREQEVLAEENRTLTRQRDEFSKELAGMRDYVGVLRSATAEVPKLRGEVSHLRSLNKETVLEGVQQPQPASALPVWKPDNTTNAGRSNPGDALQTFIWSGITTNSSEFALCVVPDENDPPDAQSLRNIIDNPQEQIFKGLFEIKRLSQTPVSANEVLVEFTGRSSPDLEVTRAVTLRKIDGEWRLVLFNERDADGKIRRIAPWVPLGRP